MRDRDIPNPHPSDRDSELRPHEYDGIQEFDHKLPNWWLWTFYGSVIFTFLYWFLWYDAGVFDSNEEVVDQTVARMETARLAALGDLNDEVLWKMAQNDSFVAAGKALFQGEGTCATCHGMNLEGGIGLNLVDQEWKWGNRPMSIYEVLSSGSPDATAGMVSFRHLGPEKLKQLVAFILSHHDPASMAAATSLNEPIEPRQL